MKVLLCGINAKYIHTNIAIRLIKGYCKTKGIKDIDIVEFSINNYLDEIIQQLYKIKPDIIGFSCYIWNIEIVTKLCSMLRIILPKVKIILGGPEVTYNSKEVLVNTKADFVVSGAGEETFYNLISAIENNSDYRNIAGITFFNSDKTIKENLRGCQPNMSELPFPYESLQETENKICYYEASRGCPFKCQYCLSSVENGVCFAPIEKIKSELQLFIDYKVKQVKFVDRTFNANIKLATEIVTYIMENDNGITNFHFEVASEMLTEGFMNLLAKARRNLFQLEIGVQSTNINTLSAISRKSDLVKLKECVKKILSFKNIHIHLDLIAGLPLEDYQSFKKSFNDVHSFFPHQLQLGFLKVLKGSGMEQLCDQYGVKYSPYPPYEVFSTDCLSYEDILSLKEIEEMTEIFYNTNRFRNAMNYLFIIYNYDYFKVYKNLAEFKVKNAVNAVLHNKNTAFEFLIDFFKEYHSECNLKLFKNILKLDFLLHERPRNNPSWLSDCNNLLSKDEIYSFIVHTQAAKKFLPTSYKNIIDKQIFGMVHLEKFEINPFNYENIECTLLFDYQNRNLWDNADTIVIE